LAADGTRWVSCRPGFFLSVRVLSRLFRRLFLEKLREAFAAGKLAFFGALAHLADARVFDRSLAELRRVEWVVYAKRPFAGPAAVLAYLGRYTHRVAIANSRLVALAGGRVNFRWRDYRHKNKSKLMTLAGDEFIHASCCMRCRRIPPDRRTASSATDGAPKSSRCAARCSPSLMLTRRSATPKSDGAAPITV
jgi:hypothetical protein